MAGVTVDFIAKEADGSIWQMVLVEEGPWAPDVIDDRLRTLQERLYRCVDVALDGGLWRLYPDSFGKPVVIRVDCYDVPEAETEQFFERFAGGALEAPDYADALVGNPYVVDISFKLNFADAG